MKKLLLVVAISGTAYGAWNALGGGDDAAPAATIDDVKATNRLWLDRLPRNERDTINVFLSITQDSVGLFNSGSQWRGSYELFRFEGHGNELQIVYPQTGERERVRTKVTQCSERGMDYCLDLEGSTRGVKRYYSMEGWEIDGDLDAARAKLEAIAPH